MGSVQCGCHGFIFTLFVLFFSLILIFFSELPNHSRESMQWPRLFSCLFSMLFSKWCHDFKQWQRHFSFFSSLIFLVQHRSIAVLFHFVCSPVRLSIDTFQLTHLSGDRKKALRRSSDLTCASDLIDLDPLSLNRVERRSSSRPGDRDFNHE